MCSQTLLPVTFPQPPLDVHPPCGLEGTPVPDPGLGPPEETPGHQISLAGAGNSGPGSGSCRVLVGRGEATNRGRPSHMPTHSPTGRRYPLAPGQFPRLKIACSGSGWRPPLGRRTPSRSTEQKTAPAPIRRRAFSSASPRRELELMIGPWSVAPSWRGRDGSPQSPAIRTSVCGRCPSPSESVEASGPRHGH